MNLFDTPIVSSTKERIVAPQGRKLVAIGAAIGLVASIAAGSGFERAPERAFSETVTAEELQAQVLEGAAATDKSSAIQFLRGQGYSQAEARQIADEMFDDPNSSLLARLFGGDSENAEGAGVQGESAEGTGARGLSNLSSLSSLSGLSGSGSLAMGAPLAMSAPLAAAPLAMAAPVGANRVSASLPMGDPVDPAADPNTPGSSSGTQITRFELQWQSADDVDNGDPDLLYRKPSGDSLSDAVLQLVYGVQGERDYEPGEFTISIPAKNFTLRDVSTGEDAGRAGSLTIPYPEDPRKTNDFSWKLIGDNYVITNTRTLSAATKGYIELAVSYPGYVHNLRDMAKHDFQAHLEVVGPDEEVLAEDSNVVQMQVDSHQQITGLWKTSSTPSLTPVDASQIPEAQRIPGEEKYYVVEWTLRVAHQGNQPYQLNLTDTISDEYGGFILEATDSSGRQLEKNVFTGWSAPGSNQYFYVKTAYPASKIDTSDRPTGQCGVTYSRTYAQVRNSATMTLTPIDRIDPVTSRTDSDTATFSWRSYWKCPEFGREPGRFNSNKGGAGTQWTALNRLRNGDKISAFTYSMRLYGTGLPWTLDGNERVLDDYGKKALTYVMTDTGAVMDNEPSIKAGSDFEFTSLSVGKPTIGKAQSYNLDSSGNFTTPREDGRIGVVNDESTANIPVITIEAKVGATWQKVADVDYRSGSCEVTYENGNQSTDCRNVLLPERTTQWRASATSTAASISIDITPTLTLYTTDAMRAMAEKSFEETSSPARHVTNTATFQVKDGSGAVIYGGNDADYGTLRGYEVESEVSSQKTSRQTHINYNDGYIGLSYRANMVENYHVPQDKALNSPEMTLWNELVEIGEIDPMSSGVWYDLLPQGVYPNTSSVRVCSAPYTNNEFTNWNKKCSGNPTFVRTIPDYNGTGRMMLIVGTDVSTKPSYWTKYNHSHYEQGAAIEFSAVYDFDSIKDYGRNTHNVIAFESDQDVAGSIEGRRGEPDNPSAGYHSSSAAAFKTDEERAAFNNLNPDHDNPVFVYAGASQAVSALSAANTGLDKKVMANNDGIWGAGTYGEDIDVWEGGTYSYRLRLTSGNETISKDLILYDSLENFYAGASNDEVDVDAPRWNGTFKSIDVSQLEAKGVKPVVYYSTVPNLRLDDANNPKLPNAQNVDLTNSAVWSTTPPSDLSKVTAIAIDASKKADGSDFELQPKESISVVMRMAAPSGEEGARAVEQDAHAYNNAFMVATSVDTKTGVADEKAFARHDYTKVGIKEFSLDVTKQWDDDNNRDGIRPAEVIVHLLANGSDTGKSLTLNAENNWQGRFEHLIHDDDSGAMIEYTVQEEQVAGYTSRTSVAGQKMTIRNTHTPERISLSGEKSWANASTNVLPASISVVLYADGKVAQRKTVKPDASGKWKYEFTNLNKYRDGGQEIVYTLGEQNIGEDWISRVEGMNIVNTYHPYGDALVSKVVNGSPERYADTEFTFKLSLLDSSGKALAGSYAFETSDGRTGTIKHGDSFTLKGGQSLRIKELPKGTTVRSVEDALPAGSMFEIVGSSEQSTTVKSNAEVTATHTNAYTAGDAVISKQVEGVPEAYAAKYADMDFSFKVSLLDSSGKALAGSYAFETSDGRTGTIKHGDSFTLKGGQSLRIKELPKGVTVRSEEALPAGSAFENNGVQEKPVKAGAVVTLGHANIYRLGDAVISKQVEGVPEAYAAKYADMDFSFKVSLLDSSGKALAGSYAFETSDGRTGTIKHGDSFTLKGGQSLRIKELPKGVTVRSEEALPADSVFTPNSDGAYVGVVAASQDVPLESVNTYNRSDAVLSKKVENATGVTGTLDFSFTISLLDSEDNVLTGQYEWEASDGRTGKIAHNGTLTLKDGQSVRIKELPMGAVVRTEEADMPGFTAQGGTVKSATVKANEDAQIAYTNTYSAVGRINLEASKSLTGQPLRNGQFVFEVYDADGKLLRAASNNGEGQVTFGALSYTQADAGKTYTYTIKEKNAGAGGITYDGREYQARVTVNDNGDGTMSPTVEYVGLDAGVTKPQFANVYHASGEAALKAWKELDGRELKAGEFSFDLLDANNNVVQTKTNAADGTISFDPLQFDETQVGARPLYVVRERAGTDSTVVYDTESVFGYQLEVVDQRDGTLGFNLTKVSVKQQGGVWVSTGETGDVAVFENSLQPGGLSVEKHTTDGTSDQDFRFKVKLTGKDVPENGTYNYDISAVDNTPIVANDVVLNYYSGSLKKHDAGEPNITDVFPEFFDRNLQLRFVSSIDSRGVTGDCESGAYISSPGFLCTVKDNSGASTTLVVWAESGKMVIGSANGGVDPGRLLFTVEAYDDRGFVSTATITLDYETTPHTASALTPTTSKDGLTVTLAAASHSANAVKQPVGANAAVVGGVQQSQSHVSLVGAGANAAQPAANVKQAHTTSSWWASFTSLFNLGGINVKTADGSSIVSTFNVSNGTVTYYDDGTVELSDGLVISRDWWDDIFYWTDRNHADWCIDSSECINRDEITAIKGKNIVLPADSSYLFADFSSWYYNNSFEGGVIDFSALDIGDTSNVTNMQSMFSGSGLNDTSFLKNWDVSNVTNMQSMFSSTDISDVSGLEDWDTSNVTDMRYMFSSAEKLSNVDGLSVWDVSKVTNMSGMFYSCWSLLNIDGLSAWDVAKVTDMFRMFGSYIGYESGIAPNRSVPHTTNLDALANWNTSSLTNMEAMFSHNDVLEDISALANWDTSHVTNMSGMFYDNDKLANVDALANWDTSHVTNMSGMFYHCNSLSDITGLSNWDTSKVTKMSGMFASDTKLVDLTPLATWNVSAANDKCSLSTYYRYNEGSVILVGASDFSVIHDAWQCNAYVGDGGTVAEVYKGAGYTNYYDDSAGRISTVKIHDSNAGIWFDSIVHYGEYTGVWRNADTGQYATDGVDGIQFDSSSYNVPAAFYLTGEGTWQRMVRFSFNPGEVAAGSKPAVEVHAGSDYQLPSANTFSNPHYTLTGWELRPKGWEDLDEYDRERSLLGTYKPDEIIPASEMTELFPYDFELVAQWTPRDTSFAMNDGEFEFTLRGGEKATFNNIPAGTAYEVYEMTEKGWVLVESSGTSGVIKPTETSQASFTNRPVEGVASVQVEASKLLDGVGAEAGEFNFRLTDGTNTQDVSNGAGGAIAFPQILVWDDSSMTEAQMLARTPANVRENAFAIYPASALPKNLTISEVAGESAGIAYDNRSITATLNMGEGGNPVVTYNRAPVFENTTKPASLQVTKNVENAPANDASEFSVRVELVNENNVPLADTSAITGRVDGSLMSLDWADGATTVKLHGGQSLMLEGIPAGAGYTVSETDMPRGWAQTALTGGTGTLEAGQTATASVTNTYGASGEVNLEAYKSLVGRELQEGEFEFELVDSTGAVIATEKNLSPDIRDQVADDEGHWSANPHKNHGVVFFDDINITKPDTYTYTIREKNTGDTTVNYDGRTVTATVTATDNGNGTLSFDVSYSGGQDGANLFENEVVPLHMWLKKTIDNAEDVPAEYADALFLYRVKLSGDTDLETHDHAITYSGVAGSVDGEYRPSQWSGDEMIIGVRAGEEVQLAYFPYGTQYSAEEIGWVLDGVRHELGDTFSYVSGEHMSGAIEGDKVTRTAHATNHYDEPDEPETPGTPPADKTTTATIKAHKAISGDYRLQGDDFTFELVDFDGNVVDSAKNTASGEVVFGEITLSEADLDKVHTYYIREQVSENASGRWQYDEKNHKVDIVTEKDEDGELIATVYYDTDEEPTFTNTYIEPVGYLALRADKEVTGEGAELAEGDFTFELRDSIGHTIATVTNEADGSVWFPTITYGAKDVGKEFTYQIVEIAGDKAGWTYDEHVEIVKVRVSDTGEAMLVVEADYESDGTFGAVFTNSYEFDPPAAGVHMSDTIYAALLMLALTGMMLAGAVATRTKRRAYGF